MTSTDTSPALATRGLADISLEQIPAKDSPRDRVEQYPYRNDLTARRVRELLDYDPETGAFTHRGKRRYGKPAGSLQSKGYIQLCIDGVYYLAHRVAFLYVHGTWPVDQLDHVNGVRSDSRIANLRPATQSQNKANSRRHRNNRAGYKGVYFVHGKWRAQITKDHKFFFLGCFDAPQEAHHAYCRAAQELFGAFWNAGDVASPADAIEGGSL